MLQSCTNIQEKLHPDLLSKILSSRYLSEYDECIHPLLGFENIQHYHDHLSSGASKDAIDIPFLALQPQDDPLHQVRISFSDVCSFVCCFFFLSILKVLLRLLRLYLYFFTFEFSYIYIYIYYQN